MLFFNSHNRKSWFVDLVLNKSMSSIAVNMYSFLSQLFISQYLNLYNIFGQNASTQVVAKVFSENAGKSYCLSTSSYGNMLFRSHNASM